jgi:short-subunit dehydrogenase
MKTSVLITGCASGIGLYAAQALLQRGYRVFATARREEDVAKLKHLGLEALQLDVNCSHSIQTALTQVLACTGGTLDVLFNNAGYGQPGAIEDLQRQHIEQQFQTNVYGLMELCSAVVPIMRKQGRGRIINNSSLLGLVAMPYRGVYAASKFAVEGLCDALRQELYGSGIKVILLEPGPIQTNFRNHAYKAYTQAVDEKASQHQHAYQKMAAYYRERQGHGWLTQSPAAVSRKLIKAIESKRPRARYYIGLPTYLLAFARRLLPTWALDYVLRKI